MRPVFLSLVLIGFVTTSAGTQQPAPTPPPGTDIFIASLTTVKGQLKIGAVTNLTRRAGYDNQPTFLADGGAILFSSARDGRPTDIYRLNLTTRAESRLTDTPDGEYSPTVTPDGRSFTVIRQAGTDQHIWKFPLAGGPGAVVIDRINPIGYHAWADDKTMVVYVLGSPATLQIVDVGTQKADTVAQNPGRSLHRMPGSGPPRVSFVHKVAEKDWIVKALDPRSRAITTLIKTLPGREDVAWTPDGVLLIGQGSKLLAWDRSTGAKWREIADLAPAVREITRIAVSSTGDRLALVGADSQ